MQSYHAARGSVENKSSGFDAALPNIFRKHQRAYYGCDSTCMEEGAVTLSLTFNPELDLRYAAKLQPRQKLATIGLADRLLYDGNLLFLCLQLRK
jgi:hypothetical protein